MASLTLVDTPGLFVDSKLRPSERHGCHVRLHGLHRPRARAHLDAITVPVTQQMALEAETELTATTVQMVMIQQGANMNADDISEGLSHLLSNRTCP